MVAVAGLLVSGPICPAMGALLGAASGRGEHEPGDGHTALGSSATTVGLAGAF